MRVQICWVDNSKFDDSVAMQMANLGIGDYGQAHNCIETGSWEVVKEESDLDSEALLLENEMVRTNGSSSKEEQDDS